MKKWIAAMFILMVPAAWTAGSMIPTDTGPTDLFGTVANMIGGVGLTPGFLPVGVCRPSNPTGFWELDGLDWRRNYYWGLFDSSAPPVLTTVPDIGGESSGGGGYPFGSSWPGLGSGASGYFGIDEGGQNSGFGIDETPVPEPSTIALIALGAAGLLRRHRSVSHTWKRGGI